MPYQPPPGKGTVTGVTATSPLHSSGGAAPNLTVDKATSSQLGVVEVDGTTITASAGGVITTVAAIQAVTVTLTAAQINGMFAAPIQVIAAQGAGTLITIYKWSLNAVFSSAAFTGGGAIGLFYGAVTPPVSQASANAAAVFLTTFAANQITASGGPTGSVVANIVPSSIAVNGGVFVSNLTGAFSGGTGATVKFTILYSVLPGQS